MSLDTQDLFSLNRLKFYGTVLLAQLVLFVAFSYSFLPFQGRGIGFEINLFLMMFYYWGVMRPSMFPIYSAFVYGLLTDVLVGQFLGFYALLYSGLHFGLNLQRRMLTGQSYFMILFGFFVFMLVNIIIVFGLQNLVGMNVSLNTHLLNALATGLFFPFVCVLLFYLNKMIEQTSRTI